LSEEKPKDSRERRLRGAFDALVRAGQRARELGASTGTPVYVLHDGKIVDLNSRDRKQDI
jgi:hypothetical protein